MPMHSWSGSASVLQFARRQRRRQHLERCSSRARVSGLDPRFVLQHVTLCTRAALTSMNENNVGDCASPDAVLGLGLEANGVVSGGVLTSVSNAVAAGGYCTCCSNNGICSTSSTAMARIAVQTCATGAFISGYLCRGRYQCAFSDACGEIVVRSVREWRCKLHMQHWILQIRLCMHWVWKQ